MIQASSSINRWITSQLHDIAGVHYASLQLHRATADQLQQLPADCQGPMGLTGFEFHWQLGYDWYMIGIYLLYDWYMLLHSFTEHGHSARSLCHSFTIVNIHLIQRVPWDRTVFSRMIQGEFFSYHSTVVYFSVWRLLYLLRCLHRYCYILTQISYIDIYIYINIDKRTCQDGPVSHEQMMFLPLMHRILCAQLQRCPYLQNGSALSLRDLMGFRQILLNKGMLLVVFIAGGLGVGKDSKTAVSRHWILQWFLQRYKDIQSLLFAYQSSKPGHAPFDRQRVLRCLRHWLCSNWSLQVWVLQVEQSVLLRLKGAPTLSEKWFRDIKTELGERIFITSQKYTEIYTCFFRALERTRPALPNVALWCFFSRRLRQVCAVANLLANWRSCTGPWVDMGWF